MGHTYGSAIRSITALNTSLSQIALRRCLRRGWPAIYSSIKVRLNFRVCLNFYSTSSANKTNTIRRYISNFSVDCVWVWPWFRSQLRHHISTTVRASFSSLGQLKSMWWPLTSDTLIVILCPSVNSSATYIIQARHWWAGLRFKSVSRHSSV